MKNLFTRKKNGVVVHQKIVEIAKDHWDLLVDENNPFLEYEFLKGLEVSKSIGTHSGWMPFYLANYQEGQLVAAIPLYLKNNSYGEYIFDWAWASLYKRAGGHYYPKLTIAVPFTPATGNRILTHPQADFAKVASPLVEEVVNMAKKLGTSSIHWLFTTKKQMDFLCAHGFMARHTLQFHWHNKEYANFDAFLSNLNAKKRNQIKRERRRSNDGVEIEVLAGEKIQPKHWEAMYQFYLDTMNRKWGHPYLTREFFSYIGKHFAQRVVMIMAKDKTDYIAGTLNFHKNKHLYGRYWGSLKDHSCLHFELCYYRLIEYAITQKIELFEAGAQGEHKIQRGLLPHYTYSAHWFLEDTFATFIAQLLQEEKDTTERLIKEFGTLSPFKKQK